MTAAETTCTGTTLYRPGRVCSARIFLLLWSGEGKAASGRDKRLAWPMFNLKVGKCYYGTIKKANPYTLRWWPPFSLSSSGNRLSTGLKWLHYSYYNLYTGKVFYHYWTVSEILLFTDSFLLKGCIFSSCPQTLRNVVKDYILSKNVLSSPGICPWPWKLLFVEIANISHAKN